MRRPTYPLQTVREQREREQQVTLRALAKCLREQEERAEKLTRAERALERTLEVLVQAERNLFSDAFSDEVNAAVEAGTVQLRSRAVEGLRERALRERGAVDNFREQLEEAGRATGVAQGALAEATRRLEVLERHQANWRAAWLTRLKRTEEHFLGEVATHAWVRQGGFR